MAQGVPVTSSKGASRFSWYVLSNVHVKHNALVKSEPFLTFATGIIFHCFASNQTGNTVVLATVVVVLIGDLVPLLNIGMPLAMFLAGGLIVG
jgi:hypothetical protein